MHATALIDFRSPGRGVPALRQAFGAPRERLVATVLTEVRAVLDAVQAHAAAGRWCVGYLRYEAAAAFDAAFEVHRADGPLASFAVYDRPLEGDEAERTWHREGNSALLDWDAGLPQKVFDAAVADIRRAIADGELYQVNYTAPLTGTGQGDPRALFAALRRAQPNAYAALLNFGDGDDTVLSVSPELFFDWRDGRLLARPMKGTAARGRNAVEDAAQADTLRTSAKERAENLMIVDLLRNDLSRVAEPFSVEVPRLFEVAAWPTVWQMSSDIAARTRAGTSLADVFGALFPCGSVTGAPKARAMRAVRRLEAAPRGIYCGAVGVVRPGGEATFNVPIRTLTWRDGRVRCGIGSGITADSTAAGEWREWRHKRAFVERASQPFELLETLALRDGQYVDRDPHLRRMADAARHFGFTWGEDAALQALHSVRQAHAAGIWRVRLLMDAAGAARAEAFVLAVPHEPVRVRLADSPLIDADGEFVRFKTTRRAHYDAFSPTDPAVFDTLLWNERGELTEFTRGNLALKLDGEWLTPAASCGLLPGVGRARWIAEGRLREAVLTKTDLARADGLAFVNSLRGWMEAALAQA